MTKMFRIFFAILLAMSAIILAMFLYLKSVINSAESDMDKIKNLSIEKELKNNIPLTNVELEADSLISKNVLFTAFLFSQNKESFDSWIEKQIKDQSIIKNGEDNYLIKKSIILDPVIRNDCDDLYCFQTRVKFEEIPSVFWQSLIEIEDIRFIEHSGVDWFSFLRALVINLKSLRFAQGGSTLTQQLIKNIFFTSEKSLKRKIWEMIYAIYAESKYSKEDILSLYFNEIHWGAVQGIKVKGVYAASLFYFQKKPNELSNFEIMILVSLLKGPNFYHPIEHPMRLFERANLIRNKIVNSGQLQESSMAEWDVTKFNNWVEQLKIIQKNRTGYLVWLALKNDSKLLNIVEKITIYDSIHKLKMGHDDFNQNDIGIKIFIGEPFCGNNCVDNFLLYSKFERDKSKAIFEEKHQVGSTLKPLIYSLFLEEGVRLDEMVSAAPLNLKIKSGNWSLVDKKNKLQEVTALDALQRSLNTPLIRLAQKVGFEKLSERLVPYLPTLQKPLAEYPSQLLGSIELTLGELYQVYKSFLINQCSKINQGVEFENSFLWNLADPNFTTVKGVVDPRMAQVRFFGKTGTTNDALDNWYIFFDGRLLGVIWVGLEGNRLDKKLNLSGAATSFKIFQSFMLNRGKQINELNCINLGSATLENN